MRPWQVQCVCAFSQIDIIIKEGQQGLNCCRFTPRHHHHHHHPSHTNIHTPRLGMHAEMILVCMQGDTYMCIYHPSNSWAFPSVAAAECKPLTHWLPESIMLKLIGVGFKQISSCTSSCPTAWSVSRCHRATIDSPRGWDDSHNAHHVRLSENSLFQSSGPVDLDLRLL